MSIADLGLVRVSARMQGPDGDDLVNVFTLKNVSGNAVAYGDAITAISEALDDTYGIVTPAISTEVAFADISFWDEAGAAPMGIVPWPTLVLGEAAGDMLPSQVAGFVFFRTHKARCIGKKFVPGPVEGNSDAEGRPTALYIAAINSWASDLIDPAGFLGASDWQFVVVSTTDSLPYTPYQAIVSSVWSTVRRRRVGRGS